MTSHNSYCHNCGTALDPVNAFCHACGIRVQATSGPDLAEAPAAPVLTYSDTSPLVQRSVTEATQPVLPPQPSQVTVPTPTIARRVPPSQQDMTYQDAILSGGVWRCPRCNSILGTGAKMCAQCGVQFMTPVLATSRPTELPDYMRQVQATNEPAHVRQARINATAAQLFGRPPAPQGYEETFARFDAEGGKFLWTWNWAAFSAGAFWCFAKGMQKRGVMMIVAFVVSVLFGGWLILPFVMGICGNWLYYRFVRDGEEKWFYGGGDR